MKNVASNYYMMKKIHQKSSLHQLTKNKMRFGHVSRALKSVVLGAKWTGPIQHPMPLLLLSPYVMGHQSLWFAEATQNGIKRKKKERCFLIRLKGDPRFGPKQLLKP